MAEPISGFFLIDKPLEWTSFQVVNKIKYLFKHEVKEKVKIGHAGTLDPLATGLLIVCYGKMTKKITMFQDLEKEYAGVIQLGAETPSFDLETEISQRHSTAHLTPEKIKAAALKMTGEIMQYPPVFSAKKIGGKRAYKMAREGQTPEVRPNLVTIHEFDITRFQSDEVSFRIRCSKGTYIRSIANDLGKNLQSGGYLKSLRRTAIGPHLVSDAMSIETLEEKFKSGDIKAVMN